MKKIVSWLALGAALSTAQGCGWLIGPDGYFRDKQDDYLGAREVAPLKIPDGMNARQLEDIYPVPPAAGTDIRPSSFEVPRPSAISSETTEKSVRIHKMGEQQWVLVDYAPAQVWPRLKQFLVDNQIGLEREDAVNGVMETSWLVRETDEKGRERFRLTVEQGVQSGSAELHVLQARALRTDNGSGWPATSDSAARERWMLDELANYLAQDDGKASVSLLAQGISTASKVSMATGGNGRPVIRLQLPYDRAWASLGMALERSKFQVVDLDRSTGHYFVDYRPDLAPGEKPEEQGMFSRLFGGWGSDDESLEGKYQLKMQDHGAWVEISLAAPEGADPLSPERTEEVLLLIKGNLS